MLPPVSALIARRRSADPDLRLLCAALAGAGFAAAACALTFDALSFPMFINVTALVIGLIGVCWRLAEREREPRTRGAPRNVGVSAVIAQRQLDPPAEGG